MLENSKDVLNIISAVSIAALVFFLCWALYYVIASARRTFKLVKRIEESVEKAESLIELIKSKVASSATYLSLLSNLVKKGMDFAEKRNERKRENKEKRKK
jgi:hypothetical protein